MATAHGSGQTDTAAHLVSTFFRGLIQESHPKLWQAGMQCVLSQVGMFRNLPRPARVLVGELHRQTQGRFDAFLVRTRKDDDFILARGLDGPFVSLRTMARLALKPPAGTTPTTCRLDTLCAMASGVEAIEPRVHTATLRIEHEVAPFEVDLAELPDHQDMYAPFVMYHDNCRVGSIPFTTMVFLEDFLKDDQKHYHALVTIITSHPRYVLRGRTTRFDESQTEYGVPAFISLFAPTYDPRETEAYQTAMIAILTSPTKCFNPKCRNVKGLRRCTGCSVAQFCSDACSKEAWPSHKLTCRALQKCDQF